MKLRDYIKSNGISVVFFAKKVGVSPCSIFNYFNGSRRPHIFRAKFIQEITDGQVTVEDLRGKENEEAVEE